MALGPPEGALHRAPRPLIGWVGVATIVASLSFLVLLAIPILRAVNRWADGQPVDMQGFAVVLTAAAGASATILAPLAQWLQNRSRERRDQIALGGAQAPFSSSPPEGGPRPQENVPQ